ncbi:MAG: S41 family peptidase [Anaerolinea sp.]|nr:S41 family peptidase [Anaerolinea sp.]
MNNKAIKFIVIAVAILIVIVGAFSGGFLAGNAFSAITGEGNLLPTTAASSNSATEEQAATTGEAALATSQEDTTKLFSPFWETWDIVHEIYVDQPVDDVSMMRGAIQGMLQSLGDKHTSYMDPDELRQANISLEGEYEGIGAWVDITGDYLVVISPMPDSPAEKAGLKPDDLVVGIDGEDMTGLDGNIVLNKILGPAGTEVVLTIKREGVEEPFDVAITRAKIIVPSVTAEMLENNIAYIQISSFGETTGQDVKMKLKELMANDPAGLILDLRYNGGGLLTTAQEVASQFLSEDVIMYEEFGDGTLNELTAEGVGLARNIPLVVLVNDGTASASEIVAGAIQDYGRGKLVGIQTYGKGSVQNWIDLKDDQGAIRVTIARWLTPLKRQINEVGLTPDVIVEITEEDVTNDRDPQLEKAIELLMQQ